MKYILLLIIFSSYFCYGQQSHILVPVANGSDSALLYLPNDYSTTTKTYPIIIVCPGSGEAADGSDAGTGLAKILNSSGSGGPAYFINQNQWPTGFTNPKDGLQYKPLVLTLQENTWGVTGVDLNTVIKYALSTWRVDPTRIYLTGLSAGGQGIVDYAGNYNMTALYPIAAWVPMSPAIDINSTEVTLPAATVAKNKTPTWCFGDSVHDIYGIAAELLYNNINKASPGLAIFTEFTTGHGPWNPFYNPTFLQNNMSIYQWMLQYTAGTATNPVNPVNPVNPIPPVTGKNVRYVITPNQDGGYYNATPTYNGGDTLDLNSKYLWTYFELDSGKWTKNNPLIIINSGGQTVLNNGFTIQSTGVHITGTGVPGVQYGFLLTNPTPNLRSQSPFAVAVLGHAKNLEFDHLYLHNVGIGFHIEMDNNCNQSYDYPNWILDSISIHDNKIVGIWNEGIYLGNTSPDNAAYDHRPDQCSVTQTTPTYSIPMKNGYTHIFNNIVDSTGRGGIQAGNTSYVEIDSNTIKHSGMNGDDAQGTGISVGLYTNSYVHDNNISNTLTWAIASIGGDTVERFVHNTMDSSGFLVNYPAIATTSLQTYDPATQPTAPDPFTYPYAIWVDTRPRTYNNANPPGTAIPGHDSTRFVILNNTIGLFKCYTSTVDNQSAIQIEDHNLGLQHTGDSICGNVSSKGQNIVVYTGNAGHPVPYSTCSGPVVIPPVNPGCPTCPTCPPPIVCPICPVVPAPRTVVSWTVIQVSGVSRIQVKFSDGSTQTLP